MKQIKSKIYEELSTTQRIACSLSALSRNDEAEIKRLVNSVPVYSYRGPEPGYFKKLDMLVAMAAAHELDQRNCAIYYLLNKLFYKGESEDEKTENEILQAMSNRDQGWINFLASLGVAEPKKVAVGYGPRHEIVAVLLESGPLPDEEGADWYAKQYRDHFDGK